MLVLSRKVGEKILIDGGIELVVLAIEGKRIRLGIEAPQDYRISRGEMLPAGVPTAFDAPAIDNRAVSDRRDRSVAVGCTA